MDTDTIFKTRIEKSSDFKFDTAVVNVFDDMVVRSVPFYIEFQRMIAEIATDYAKPNSNLYDLGCSTGTTFQALDKLLDESIRFSGMDESAEMLEKCRENLTSGGIKRPFHLETADLNQPIQIENASVVILCLTLQFVRPINRQGLIQCIHRQMNEGGCLILIEKILAESPGFNRQYINYYYNLKRRNNYNDLEIAQKREALENVLIPYKVTENLQLLKNAGFSHQDVFFKWYNFAGMIAIK